MCKKCTHGGGSGGRPDAKIYQISPLPSDGDPVAFVGVSIVSTKTLVSIGYGPIKICHGAPSVSHLLFTDDPLILCRADGSDAQ